jgi:pimeloyl-ACP methyl ester carboxylesterase
MNTVTSKDGTRIAYDRTGTGEPLVLVAGAFSYRKYPGQLKLAKLLADRFTVYNYDRRGRGDSSDTAPYGVEREIEDLAALIEAAGGSAHVWGLSSGAALALASADAGLPITRLAVQEPPFVVDPSDRRPPADLHEQLQRLLAEDRRGEAVRYFLVEGMGAPSFVPTMLHLMPGAWGKLTAVAHTLPYDALLTQGFRSGSALPSDPWPRVTMPTLVMSGTERDTPAFMVHAAAAVAAALPAAQLVQRKGLGHTKKLTPRVIADTLTGFLTNADEKQLPPARNAPRRANTQPVTPPER